MFWSAVGPDSAEGHPLALSAQVLPSSGKTILGLYLTEKNTPICSKACLDYRHHTHHWPDNWNIPDRPVIRALCP